MDDVRCFVVDNWSVFDDLFVVSWFVDDLGCFVVNNWFSMDDVGCFVVDNWFVDDLGCFVVNNWFSMNDVRCFVVNNWFALVVDVRADDVRIGIDRGVGGSGAMNIDVFTSDLWFSFGNMSSWFTVVRLSNSNNIFSDDLRFLNS